MTYGSTQGNFWAAAPKGSKSCRTQGDFRSSPQALTGLKSDVIDLRISPLKPKISPLRPQISLFRPQISPLRLQI